VKYAITVGDTTYQVEISGDGRVAMEGVPCQVDIENIDGYSLFSLLVDNRSYELMIEREGAEFRILIRGELYTVRVEDEWSRRLKEVSTVKPPSEEVAVKAPMPGLVVAVPVQAGQEVKMGQGLVILEAMKMENELRAPRAGVVKAVRVSPGQVVDKDQLLVVIG